MDHKLAKIFKEMKEIEPHSGFEGLILKKIDLERRKQVKRKLFLSYAGLTVSFAATFCAFVAFGNSFLQSDFWSMISLIFSDIAIIAGNLNSYGYSLLETFPFVNLIGIMIPLFAMLLSINIFLSLRRKIKQVSFNSYKAVHI